MLQSDADLFRVGNRNHFGLAVVILLSLLIFNSAKPSLCQANQSVAADNSDSNKLELLQKAAEQGDPSSQCLLGLMYSLGNGVPKDYSKGADWMQKAAANGNMRAQNSLGLMYRDGKGVPKDYSKAAEWFQRAAAQGDDIAKQNLETMRSDGKLGNFADFQAKITKSGLFAPSSILNGFSTYQSKEEKLNLLSMRSCDGYCCEGFVSIQPMAQEDLDAYLLLIYAPLQNTLSLTNKDSVPPAGYKARVSLLREKVMTNLQQSNRIEFAFDHLNVRGQCPPVSETDFKAGLRPQLTIKLWIP